MKTLEKACIIDDDPIMIFGMKLMMKQLGVSLQTEIWNNGQEAIEGLERLANKGEALPRVVFLDLTMPIMDGWDFLEALKQSSLPGKETMEIYVLSSSINPSDKTRALNYALVKDYIAKPIAEERLQQILTL
ncbi:response regulator [Robiginitalea sp. IMCC43444]|uniref:response regulator n=1 Tax=Robiginitalea sp. IMCC43444 TaxID=3459121 RepID=UPI004040EACC